MLERLAAWFLNTYVAEYVGNVVTDQLSIGLLKGAVELEKLPLKRDALKKLKLPVDVKSGYIGKLKLQIPVRYIKSQPWVVQIDQLYIVAGPAKPGAYNEEEEEALLQAAKQSMLAKLEEEWMAEQQKNKGWWSWSPFSLPSNVIANLQVIVNDVHIRYEDQDAVPGHPFTMGVMLENISAQSTDDDWEPKFVAGEDKAFKLIDLKNFTVYSDTEVFAELEGQALVDAMLKKHGSVITQQQPMTASTFLGATPTSECLVKPVSGQAKLTRDCSKIPLRISDGPRFHVDVQLDEIPIFLSDKQYESLVRILETFNLRVKARKFQRRRPLVGVAGNTREWWRFAIETALHEIRRRNLTRSRGFALNRAHQNVVYVMAYMQHLTQEVMLEEVKDEMKLIENEQSFEELAVLRKLAMARVKRQRGLVEAVRRKIESESQASNQGILQRWFPGWISGADQTTTDTSEHALSSDDDQVNDSPEVLAKTRDTRDSVLSEEDELMNELGYESQDSVFLRDRIFLTLSFSLSGGSFQLVSTPSSLTGSFLGPEPLVELGFSSLCCSVDLRPKLRYATFDLSLGSLSVQDHTDPDSLFPVLVQPKGVKVSSEKSPLLQRQYTVFDPLDATPESSSLFELKFTAEEVGHCKHYQVRIQSKPIDIVYNPSTIARVKQFLATPHGGRGTMDKLSREIQYQTTAGLKNKLEDILEGDTKMDSHSVVSVKLDISAPHIILPEDFKNENTSLVVLDLGHVTFGNVSDWSNEELGMEVEHNHIGGDDDDEDDDDLFQTPLSSPPSEEEEATDSVLPSQPLPPDSLPTVVQSGASLKKRQSDPYERYLLRLSDLQVLVGKAGENWKEVIRSGQSPVHLLDKFTLSFQIQRMVRPISGSLEPSTSLTASLPSLRFHIDEEKVHTLISCLRTMTATPEDSVLLTPPTQHSPTHNDLSYSLYQSAFSPEDINDPMTSEIQASMYHSAAGDTFTSEREENGSGWDFEDPEIENMFDGDLGRGKVGGAKETRHRKTLYARERQFCAQLSINEALLGISSRGRLITELRVPGIKFGLVKRPYDVGLQVLVQDLFLVDRIQSFGPGYELVVCSSGRTLLSLSPLSPNSSKMLSDETGFYQTTGLLSPQSDAKNDLDPPENLEMDNSDLKDYSVFSNVGLPTELFSSSLDKSGHALLALSYSLLTPDSPQHPATLDQDEDETTSVGDEPNIHRISLECTAVDAIANQEVIMELISFFHRALPEEILHHSGSEESNGAQREEKHIELPQKPLHTELNIKFERLGIRILRKISSQDNSLSQIKPPVEVTRLISEVMLYGLTVDGTVSMDVLIQGKLEGIRVTDLTPTGKKYADILLMGAGSGLEQEATPTSDSTTVKQNLSFSISRSQRPLTPVHSQQFSDVHLNVFVPTIRYTHSVNFVYEMEIFVSEFQSYSSLVSDSFKTAAVGVARGFVSEESRLAKGLSKLHVSFGRTLSRDCHSFLSEDYSDIEEIDAREVPSKSNDRIYLDFSIQSPVIVLPSSLKKDDCLVAHLGEITINNEFITPQEPSQSSLSESFSVPSLSLIDRLTISITRVSLHATRDEQSKKELLSGSTPKDAHLSHSKKCFKVLRETSAMVQVDKRLGHTKMAAEGGSDDENVADLVITGKVCDPLLVKLPKEVFDQIRSTLKHGIRREPPKSKFSNTERASDDKIDDSQSSDSVELTNDVNKSSMPSIIASFSLPKLSLELKHTLEAKEKNLVYISFDGFSVQCSKLDPHVTTFDLSLKSIVIEDLLQPEDSDYRYILASSIKPLRLISPVPTPTKNLGSLSVSSLSRHFFPFSQLMSTPKPQASASLPSPLRSFNPRAEDGDSFGGEKSSSRLSSQSGELGNESGSTLVEESSGIITEGDLLTIKATYVDEKSPSYSTTHNSESLHASVDFSSVFVIINLQTWVVLFDYLGIGIPTPPPSRSMTPDPPYPEPSIVDMDEELMTGSNHVPLVDRSLLEDALDFTSLGSDPASSLYTSAWQSLPIAPGLDNKDMPNIRDQVPHLSSDGSDSERSMSPSSNEGAQAGNSVWGVDGKISMGVELNVKSLTVTFNKPEHPLARGNVSLVSAQVKMRRGNVEITGMLGQASVTDLTETGAYYRERFTTTGEQALTFDIFKYGRPDPFMERPYDVSVKVVMSSVRYLHTMRFLKEILSFLSHFPQLIDAFQRMKAMAEGNLVYHGPERKARLSFDVEISGPLLLIPKHAFSPDLMVGDIGHVKVTNAIRYDDDEGTISHMRKKQGLDEIRSITGTDYGPLQHSTIPRHTLSPQASAQSVLSTTSDGSTSSTLSHLTSVHSSGNISRIDSFPTISPLVASPMTRIQDESLNNSMFGSFQSSTTLTVEEDRQRIEKQLEAFKGPCLLDCIVVELSDVDVFSAKKVGVGNGKSKIMRQPGKVLKEKGAAKLFIERNLYEDFCRDVPDFHVEGTLEAIHVLLDKSQLEVIKGLIEMNLGETIEEFEKPSTVIHDPIAQPIATDVWTGFLFRMQFVGVQMEFLQSRHSEQIPGSITRSLARFQIQESEFSFEARSNQCQTVDLTSRSVIGFDTRYEDYDPDTKPSVFEEVLRPRFATSNKTDGKKKAIQVEIHVTLSPKQIKASILLNKLRLIGIFDLILELKSFVFDKLPEEEDSFDEVDSPYQHVPAASSLLQQQLASYKVTGPRRREVKKPSRDVLVKLSVTETDFVVVEDTRFLNSNAVVLKSTLILKFQSTQSSEKTINCSIDGLELFSCALSNEDETALSILDPVSVSVDVKPLQLSSGKTEEELTGSAQILEVEIQQLNFRLSYNDIKLFVAIAQSLPAMGSIEVRESPIKHGEIDVDETLVKRLLPLGFTKASIRKELYFHGNDPNAAALKLLSQQEEKETSVTSSGGWESSDSTECLDGGGEKEGEKDSNEKPFTIKSIQVRVGSISVCLIDDSINRDVPLLDFSLVDFQAEHHLMVAKQGCARGVFAGDYYNRNISAWEPVVEQWNLQVDWQIMRKYSTDLDSNDRPDRMCLTISSAEKLCVNVTSSLIHILKATQASWTQDLEKHNGGDVHKSSSSQKSSGGLNRQSSSDDPRPVSNVEKGLALLHSVRFVSQTRQRTRFVPFLLRNSTGLPLKFATLTSVPSKVYVGPSALYQKTQGHMRGLTNELSQTSDWMEVRVGGEKPFDFSSKGKLRHRDTRELVVHQLLIKVAGWECIHIPISVDKIGVFFREVWPTNDTDFDSLPELPLDRGPVRLVFAISLSDTQKVVNIRSALVLVNTMELPLEVKLENTDSQKEDKRACQESNAALFPLRAKGYAAVPIHLTSQSVRVRPVGWGVQYCSKHLAWKHVSGKLPTSHTRECEAIGEGVDPPFRFCVSVRRENFPIDPSPLHPHPAHTITLYPPLTVTNLLPCDVQFCLVRNGLRKIVKRGKEIAVYSVDSMKAIEFKTALEGFVHSQSCVVSMDTVGRPQGMSLEDTDHRPLRLTVTSEVLGGTALKISLSCSYWLINRTGLPLVFKQNGLSQVAALQHEENEKASTTTPLLFSYSDGEHIEACTMRLGNKYRYLNGGKPVWCSPFRMISGSGVIRVFVRSKDGRPDLEYQIGVDIRRGRRQYQGTRVVTLVARYQLENKTQYKMAYLQRHQLQDEEALVTSRKIPIIMPNAVMSFHWPRIDLDQLLCVKVEDIPDCRWSGGFSVDKDRSFHIQMRGRFGHSVFVRCEVTLISATYHIILSDAANYPPPFRLENLSQMPVVYHQSRTNSLCTLNPGQSVPYAWDEPMSAETMCLQVKGLDVIKEFDFNTFGTRGKLYYESYFFVSAVCTFAEGRNDSAPHEHLSLSFSSMAHKRRAVEDRELVLDVPQGTAVIFNKKDPEKRTQLWRMSASRQLVHIASSSQSNTNMVLDITGGKLPGKGQVIPLVIKRASSSRSQSQSWRFTEDGRLLLDATPYLCVQSRPGYESMREGVDAVLGHLLGGCGPVPHEQMLRRMKHSPGSGVLSVNVISDGPTRTLRVTDVNNKYTHTSPHDDWIIVEHGLVAPVKSSDVDSCQDNSWDSDEGEIPSVEMELSLVLEEGIGVSLINSVPEELIFVSLAGIRVEFISSSIHQCLNATVQHIQVDNNLATSHTPVLAYPTPPDSGEQETSYPVLKVVAEKVPHRSPFAQVFKLLELKVRDITLLLEEKLLFKLLQWAGVGQAQEEEDAKEEEIMNMLTIHRSSSPSSSRFNSTQIYFEHLKISDVELRVSMLTTSQLPEDLLKIKRHLGFPLVKFESPIYLDGVHQAHTLGDVGVYVDSLTKHYKGVVKSQSIKILGSVDFLGNPVGLLTDVASGVTGLIAVQPDVFGLVRDVAHGMSDTTSKLTGTVSHVFGQVTLDSSYQEEREQILESCQSSSDHFKAGLMGLSSGVFGGVTSILTQPYKGAQEYGVGGFIAGIGKGVIGTVAKPVAGLFDFASGTTAALRETTSRVSRYQPTPVRHRRCCVGASGALTPYSISQARGQEYLLRLTDGEVSEKLVSYELLYESPSNRKDRMKVIISSQYLYFFRDSPPDPKTLDSQISLDELAECRPAQGKSSIPTVYIVLSLIDKDASYRAPKYKCSDEKKARKVAQLINYAKNFHEEEKHVIRTLRLQCETIW